VYQRAKCHSTHCTDALSRRGMDLWQRSFDDYGSLGQLRNESNLAAANSVDSVPRLSGSVRNRSARVLRPCPQRMEGYPAVSGLGRNLANRLRTQFTR